MSWNKRHHWVRGVAFVGMIANCDLCLTDELEIYVEEVWHQSPGFRIINKLSKAERSRGSIRDKVDRLVWRHHKSWHQRFGGPIHREWRKNLGLNPDTGERHNALEI